MKKLQRFPNSGYIGGVCHGLGLHTGIAPIIWRVIAVFTPSILIYIIFWNFLQDDKEKPMVFCWMPAISIYFSDPDGHYLEFIGILPGKSRPDEEKRVVTYEQWLEIEN